MKKARAILPKTSDNQCAATTTLDKETNKAKDNNKKIARALKRNSFLLKAKKIQTKKGLIWLLHGHLGNYCKEKLVLKKLRQ